MKIRIDLKILFFLALFYFTKQIKVYLLVLGFAFLHELAHLLVGLLLGFKPQVIKIMPFGFNLQLIPKVEECEIKIKKATLVELKNIYVAIAGPFFNLVIATIFSYIGLKTNNEIDELITYSNLLIFFFNLLPIYPLDGGRVIYSVLKINKGSLVAKKIMNIIKKITIILLTIISSIAILYLKNIAILFIIIYLWILVWKEEYIKKVKKF